MAKNLLRRVMAASFRGAENADATNVTRRLVLAHEVITPSSGCLQELTIDVPVGRQPRALFGLAGSAAVRVGGKPRPDAGGIGRARGRLWSSAILAAWRSSIMTLVSPAGSPASLRVWSSAGGFEGAHQAVLGGVQRRGGAAGYAELRVEVLDVVGRRLRRDHKPLGDFPVRVAAGQQPEHLDLACGEPAGPCPPGGRAMARGSQDSVDRLAVQPAGDDLGPQVA